MLGVSALVLAVAGARAQDVEAGRDLYETTCANCHGERGDRAALGQSRPLKTLAASDIRTYLKAKQGMAEPQRTQDRIKAALTDEEMEAVAAYAAQFGRQ
ncbi:c-type cytochrome [Rhodomicrobium sp.]|uniref:c-type cytochrome n=1 Tax=Rhodomicrobium sp. TaxID=2720632 RepID=UPI0039E6F0D8